MVATLLGRLTHFVHNMLRRGLVGIAHSLYLLGRDWDRAVAWWEIAACQRTTWGTSFKTRRLSASTKAFCIVPWLWVVFGALWLCLMLAKNGGPPSGIEAFDIFCALSAAAAFAIWLSVLLHQVSRWRAAQERFWLLWQPEAKSQSAPLLPWQWWLVWGTAGLAIVQAALFSRIMYGFSSGWGRALNLEELLGFLLLVVMLHYPTMWCAMLLKEFLLLERFYETRRQALSMGEEE